MKQFWSDPTRRALAIWIGSVVGLVALVNSGAVGWFLSVLGFFDDTAVANWEETLQDNSLSILALIPAGILLDILAREREKVRLGQTVESVSSLIDEKLEEGIKDSRTELSTVVTDAVTGIDASLEATVRAAMSTELDKRVDELVKQALAEPLSLADPRELVQRALENSLASRPDRFPALIDGLIARPVEIIEDATFDFRISNISSGETEYLLVGYSFKGRLQAVEYGTLVVQGNFHDENKVFNEETVTDGWLIHDDWAYAESVRRIQEAGRVDLAYASSTDNKTRVLSRGFTPMLGEQTKHEYVAAQAFVADIQPPEDCVDGSCEVRVSFEIVLPLRPSSLRWVFDKPIFVREISYDVSGLWPEDEQLNFTLFPFLLTTEDYTPRSHRRLPVYRIRPDSWLSQGHGVVLEWDNPRIQEGKDADG